MAKDKVRVLDGNGDPEFDIAKKELLGTKAELGDALNLQTDKFLDVGEEQLKDASGDELQMLSKLYELDIDVQSKAVQGMLDYMADVVAKATALMANLDTTKLANAINGYQQAHHKAEKPEPKVAAGLKAKAGYYGNEVKMLLDAYNKLKDEDKKYLPTIKIQGAGSATRHMSCSWGLLPQIGEMLDADYAAREATDKKTAAKVIAQDDDDDDFKEGDDVMIDPNSKDEYAGAVGFIDTIDGRYITVAFENGTQTAAYKLGAVGEPDIRKVLYEGHDPFEKKKTPRTKGE